MDVIRHPAYTIENAVSCLYKGIDVGIKVALVVFTYCAETVFGSQYDMVTDRCVAHKAKLVLSVENSKQNKIILASVSHKRPGTDSPFGAEP